MGKRTTSHCCVPGCKSGYRSTNKRNKILGLKNPSLFSIKNQEELDEYSKVIPRLNKELQIGSNVCGLHFREDEIIRYHETLLPDGTVWRMDRLKPLLKKGAVPTIFPDFENTTPCPDKRKRKSTINTSLKNKKLSSNNNPEFKEMTLNKYSELSVTAVSDNSEYEEICESGNSSEVILDEMTEHTEDVEDEMTEHTEDVEDEMTEHTEDIEDEMTEHTEDIEDEMTEYTEVVEDEMTEHAEVVKGEITEFLLDEMTEHADVVLDERSSSVLDVKIFSYSTLVNNLECVSKPDLMWGITVHDEFVMCAKWNEDSALVKRVIIDYNLKVHVFLKSKAIDFDNVEINSIEDLSSILQEIENYGICKNVNDPKNSRCDGYILPNSKRNLCEYCQITGLWDTTRSKSKDTYWLSKGRNFSKYEALYNKIHTLNMKNAQLKEQMTKIIKIKAVWKLTK